MSAEKTPPELEDPSILDYLKSRLKFWEHRQDTKSVPEGKGIPRVAEARPQAKKAKSTQTDEINEQQIQAEASGTPVQSLKTSPGRYRWPWRSLLALFFALLGQRAFEPSANRSNLPGLIFYGFGFAWLILAMLRKEWAAPTYPEPGARTDTLRVRRLPLILAIIFCAAAFLTLGGNMFTQVNVTLWILAIIFFAWSFWLTDDTQPRFWQRVRDFLKRDRWDINVTRWSLLVLAVAAVVVFFRIYNLGGAPAEPFSDHAEKILDVYDVSQGSTDIFFPRNTGREAMQMYLTLAVAWLFNTGLSFLSLKIGTVFCGLATLPYMYLLGKEFGGRRLALLAVLFVGIAYWPNVISRAGLRFPLYPLFVAPTLFYLLRGLRTRNRNDFILCGLFLGLGLHGYSPFRIMPIVVLVALGLYLLHAQSRGNRKQVIVWLSILAIMALIVFLPLARYWLENPQTFSYRAFSRLGSVETPLPGPAWQILLSNTWNALRMFNWDNGEIWVHSVPHRPALDVVSGALFLIGVLLMLYRYLRRRHWQDLFLLLTVPLLQLPSILSLAFPAENPALNRAAGALVPTFLLVAIALDGLLERIMHPDETSAASTGSEATRVRSLTGTVISWVLVLLLAGWSSFQNYDLVFNQYARQYAAGAWNSSEMGAVIKQFGQTFGSTDKAWIVPYPYWVDTRLPGVWAGIPNRDFAIWSKDFEATLDVEGTKLFIINMQDTEAMDHLRALYPTGAWSHFISNTGLEGKDFMIFLVPAVR